MGVPYRVIVEAQEYPDYAAVLGVSKLLVLDPKYQADYQTFDPEGDAENRSKGPGPARNFAWDHSISEGHAWHWVMDDNIAGFYRLNQNHKTALGDGALFECMEEFCSRYKNIAMAGPAYELFTPRKRKHPVMIFNTRIYSCNLIRNDVPFRWRGRYNEDTDLSLCMLKAHWCTVQFVAFLQKKMGTQRMAGGNMAEFYEKEGTLPKSQLLAKMHPDVAKVVWKFNRWHHYVDYRKFAANKLLKKPDVEIGEGIKLELRQERYGAVSLKQKRELA
jgi:TET-associated glycosyltransferase-like protein